MRRSALGLAAAAVIAGAVGFAGAAQALPAYQSLGTNGNTLTDSSGNTWYISSCSFGGTGGCADFVMYNDGNGIGLAGAPGVSATSFPTLGSEISNGASDVTIDLFEYTGSTFFTGSATIGSAHLSSVGTTAGGTSTVYLYNASGNVTNTYSIGLSGSNVQSAVSFTPVNTVEYSMDVPLTTGLVTVTYGTPVPEPSGASLVGLGLLGVAFIRRRTGHGFLGKIGLSVR